MPIPRQLLLLRHAKASEAPVSPDAARPLCTRGLDDVPLVAEFARANGFVPDLILCSTAVRARQTAELLHATVVSDAPLVFEERLYMAAPHVILACVAAAPSELRTVAVVGHNMGIEYLAKTLAGDDFPHDSMPTCGLACFSVSTDSWDGIAPDVAQLVAFTRPKALRSGGDA